MVSDRKRREKETDRMYPACIGIQEPPPDAIFSHLLHAATSIQEHGQHPLPEFNDADIFLRFSGFCSVVGHGVLFWNGRYDERRMQSYQSVSQRGELGVSALDLQFLQPVSDVLELGAEGRLPP